jgi:predicted outer membrane repeat protein
MYGGFPPGGGDGTFDARDTGNPSYETTLTGAIGLPGDSTDNAYHVVTANTVNITTILDGFTITDGNADGGNPHDKGGGMLNTLGSPKLVSCVFENNYSLNNGGGLYSLEGSPHISNSQFIQNRSDFRGGGAYFENGQPTVLACVFIDNRGKWRGGGLGNSGGILTMNDSTFTGNNLQGAVQAFGAGLYNLGNSVITNCKFNENWGARDGGGVFNTLDATISHCEFIGNSAGYGGGLFNYSGSNPHISNCTFLDNTAWSDGGGVFSAGSPSLVKCSFVGNTGVNSGAGMHTSGNPAIKDCWFVANSGVSSGGGMLINGSPTISNCSFCGNAAVNGGGLYNDSNSFPELTNCLVVGNVASANGGGIANSGGNPTIANCTLSANVSNDGGGIHLGDSSSAAIVNSVLWNNSATSGAELSVLGNSFLAISYSDVAGWIAEIHSEPGANIVWASGMIDATPKFINDSFGTWTGAALHDVLTGQTVFEDAAGGWADDALTGKLLNPNLMQSLQSLILSNTATTITVAGDFASLGSNGVSYEVSDYRLTIGSPCIDAGDNTAVPLDTADLDTNGDVNERVPVDLDLHPRFVDTPPNGGTGIADLPGYPGIVDMGAYEFSSADCNTNGLPDICDLDCGTNGGPCDVPGCGESSDCNLNAIPDECEPQNDCQLNGVQDICDIAAATSADCHLDGIPDECQLTANDCNSNTVPDDCEIVAGTSQDCNANSIPDECDIDQGTSDDCQPNGVPDECDLVSSETTCCEQQSGPGCDSPSVEACVCLVDPYCCSVEWDRTCVDEVTSEGCGSCDNDCNTNGIPDDCEADFDGDDYIDECDSDIDNDGVLNDDDVCDYTPFGGNIVADPLSPLYGTLRADLDGDCDCDLADFAIMQGDFTGPGVG